MVHVPAPNARECPAKQRAKARGARLQHDSRKLRRLGERVPGSHRYSARLSRPDSRPNSNRHPMKQADDFGRAVLFMIAAALVLPLVGACAKYLSSYPIIQVTWARYAGHFAFMLMVFGTPQWSRPTQIITGAFATRPIDLALRVGDDELLCTRLCGIAHRDCNQLLRTSDGDRVCPFATWREGPSQSVGRCHDGLYWNACRFTPRLDRPALGGAHSPSQCRSNRACSNPIAQTRRATPRLYQTRIWCWSVR